MQNGLVTARARCHTRLLRPPRLGLCWPPRRTASTPQRALLPFFLSSVGFCFCFCFFLIFCHFSKKKKPGGAPAMLGGASPAPTQTQNQGGPSPGLAEGPRGCLAPRGPESLLHSNGTEPGTERTPPFSKYIYMCVCVCV